MSSFTFSSVELGGGFVETLLGLVSDRTSLSQRLIRSFQRSLGRIQGVLETLDKELQQLEDDRRNALTIDEESSAKLEALERDGKKIEQARRQELEKLNKAAKAAKKNADGAKKALSEAEKRLKKARGGVWTPSI